MIVSPVNFCIASLSKSSLLSIFLLINEFIKVFEISEFWGVDVFRLNAYFDYLIWTKSKTVDQTT